MARVWARRERNALLRSFYQAGSGVKALKESILFSLITCTLWQTCTQPQSPPPKKKTDMQDYQSYAMNEKVKVIVGRLF